MTAALPSQAEIIRTLAEKVARIEREVEVLKATRQVELAERRTPFVRATARRERAPKVDPHEAAALIDAQADRLAPISQFPTLETQLRRWRKGERSFALLRKVEEHLEARGGNPTDAASLPLLGASQTEEGAL